MNEPMHDLLAATVDRNANAFSGGASFAEGHGGRVIRSIRARRVAAYAGTGTAAAIGAAGVVFGGQALAGAPLTLSPASQPSSDPSIPLPSITPAAIPVVTPGDPATTLATTLVRVPLDDSIWPEGETDRSHVFYASLGATDMIPFPASGLSYPGIPNVPSDAIIVSVDGYVGGFDLSSSESGVSQIWAASARTGNQMVGGLENDDYWVTDDGHNAPFTWDVIGDVTDHTVWGIHYYVVNGEVVTEVEGRANPDAIEVTAMFDPASFD